MNRLSLRYELRQSLQRCLSHQSLSGPVLEIGSGRDRFSRTLFSKHRKVVTTNIFPQNIVDYICSVNCLPFKENEFGCVICEHVLEHVEEPAGALDEMRRVLKPAGLLILIVPFSWPIHEKPYDLWRFTEEGLRHLLMRRFTDVQFERIGKPDKPALICVTARKPAHMAQKGTVVPKVSVIMPTCNRASMIGHSIESIRGQTLKDWELIIVSDGSTDGTREAVARFHDPRIRFFHKKNGGCASARNYGLRRAWGEYIAYCDDDDILLPYHLETLTGYLDRHPEVGLVRGSAVRFINNSTIGHSGVGFLWATAHRRRLLKKVGLFDCNLSIGEDIEFILRFSDFCSTAQLRMIVARYRQHKTSYTVINARQTRKQLDMLYAKRLRVVCKSRKIGIEYFLLIAFLLKRMHWTRSLLELSQIAHSRHDCPEASYLLAWAHYINGNLRMAARYLKRVNTDVGRDDKLIIPRSILKDYARAFLRRISMHVPVTDEHRWGALLFMKNNFRNVDGAELWKIAGRIFLLGKDQERRVSTLRGVGGMNFCLSAAASLTSIHREA